MESPRRPTHSGTTRAQDGLTDWSSKIQELRRLVDADEETEQKKLEEEIASSRLARQRRSRVGRTNSVDLAQDRDLMDRLGKLDEATNDEPTSEATRKHQQNNALEQLSGLPHTRSPPLEAAKPAYSHPAAFAKRTEPMSLAAFMGGTATGPRLNKHAPQQDASDPTQFEQRTKIAAPHPVFGRGGIAMPGLAARSKTLPPQASQTSTSFTVSIVNKDEHKTPDEQRSNARSTSPLPPRTGAQPRPYSPQKARPTTPTWQSSNRTNKDASSVEPLRKAPMPSFSRNKSSDALNITRPVSTSNPVPSVIDTARSQSPVKAPGALPRAASSPTPSYPRPATSPIKQPSPVSRSREPAPALFLPKQHTAAAPPPSYAQVPSLARPAKTEPRHPSPKIPPSQNPSRAFSTSPQQKDPTPSLSRLKGRGFVQSMIKASSELEIGSMPPLPSPVDKPVPTGKKVLQRWQPASVSPSSTPPPVIAPKPKTPMRKSTGSDEQPLLSPISERKKRASLPSPGIAKDEEATSPVGHMPPEGTPGLGSGSTLISYMRPPPKAASPSNGCARSPSPRIQAAKATSQSSSDKQEDSSKPLLHPTKSRARKPKRDSSTKVDRSSVEANHTPPPAASSPIISEKHTPNVPNTVAPPPMAAKPVVAEKPAAFVPFADRVSTGKLTEQQLRQSVTASKPETTSQSTSSSSATSFKDHPAYRALPGLAAPQKDRSPPGTAAAPRVTPPSSASGPGSLKDHPAYRALPGMSSTSPRVEESPSPDTSTPPRSKPSKPSPGIGLDEDRPRTPGRHARIPSTGNRATVMDVAQVLNEHSDKAETASSPVLSEPLVQEPEPEPTPHLRNEVPPARAFSPSQLEKRRSNYEKYSSFMMPILPEESPAQTPAGTLARAGKQAPPPGNLVASSIQAIHAEKAESSNQVRTKDAEAVVHFDHSDSPLPNVNVSTLLTVKASPSKLRGSDVEVISTEVLSITATSTTTVGEPYSIFYDTEVLAVVQRSKSRSSGLVKSAVWGWQGQQSILGNHEATKLQEVAKRYGTSLLFVEQYAERADLLQALGGTLVIRRGHRSRWSPENTSMLQTQKFENGFIIDELELSKTNLCSGFTYCITFLNTVYVWHGRGSLPVERQACLEYAQQMAGSEEVVAYNEGNEDDIFWMIFGDEDYARSHYWKYRLSSTDKPRAWRIDAQSGKNAAYPLAKFSEETFSQSGVFLLDCIWEFYVIVGADARESRQDIRLAIDIGTAMCSQLSASRPYTPNLHVVILPSRIPIDLPMHFRQPITSTLETDTPPDHMNILSSAEAIEHLNTSDWPITTLKDTTMLPLGLGPDNLQIATEQRP